MQAVTVRVPATSANLGSAFDTAGIAFSLYNVFRFEKSHELRFVGFDEAFCNERNLAYVAYRSVCNRLGVPDTAVITQLICDVPVSRGLGSSATLIAAGAYAANVLHGGRLCDTELLAVCSEIEGHPDNVAPALFGGLCVSLTDEGIPFTVRYSVADKIHFTVVYPDFEVSTQKARAALPDKVSRHDAVFNLSHAALLPHAFETGDTALLRAVTKDKLHEQYRRTLFRNIDEIEAAAKACGAHTFLISGAGSACLCLSEMPIADSLNEKTASLANGWRAYALQVDEDGTQITETLL